MNFGPQHPAAHGVLRLVLELDGEVVDRTDPHIGLLHRGTEKLIEYRPYLQSIGYFDRLDYVSMMCQEHAYVLAIENLLGIEIPTRAIHPGAVLRDHPDPEPPPQHHHDGARHRRHDAAALGLRGAREAHGVLRAGVGARMHATYFRPGGVARDMPAGLTEDIRAWIASFPKVLDDIERLLNENRIFRQRTVDIGVVSADDALDLGFTGPMLRASGVPWDLRKSQPYEVYHLMDFDVPVGRHGDCFDRYLMRMAEMRESLKIMTQCLDQMPAGPIKIQDYKIAPPPRAS